MAITTYAQLQTAIGNHLDRSDLSSYYADFIMLGETLLNFGLKSAEFDLEPLRVRDMETISSLTPTSGVVTLPSSFLEPRRVVEKASIRRPLDYITPEQAEHLYPSRVGGLASHYTIIGDSLYTFDLATNDIEVVHYRTIPPLASNDPNWLLTKAPNIYLRASLFEAAMFAENAEEALKQAVMLKALVGGMNAADVRANYARAGVYLQGPTP